MAFLLPRKGVSKLAFTGKMLCPFCNSSSWKYIEDLGPFRRRYRCKKCHRTVQYDFSNNPNAHPYQPLGYKWNRLVERSKKKARTSS